jgi:hypothetical protein
MPGLKRLIPKLPNTELEHLNSFPSNPGLFLL